MNRVLVRSSIFRGLSLTTKRTFTEIPRGRPTFAEGGAPISFPREKDRSIWYANKAVWPVAFFCLFAVSLGVSKIFSDLNSPGANFKSPERRDQEFHETEEYQKKVDNWMLGAWRSGDIMPFKNDFFKLVGWNKRDS